MTIEPGDLLNNLNDADGFPPLGGEIYDESHSACGFRQRTDRADVHAQPITRSEANHALANGWPPEKILHAHDGLAPWTERRADHEGGSASVGRAGWNEAVEGISPASNSAVEALKARAVEALDWSRLRDEKGPNPMPKTLDIVPLIDTAAKALFAWDHPDLDESDWDAVREDYRQQYRRYIEAMFAGETTRAQRAEASLGSQVVTAGPNASPRLLPVIGSPLLAVIEGYLRAIGFTTYEKDGTTYWGHPNLGHGRTFENAVSWWIGTERGRANQLAGKAET